MRSADRAPRPEQALRSAASDERIGPAIGASGLRLRYEFTDVDLILDLTADQHGRNLSWSFAERPGVHPKLTLAMTAAIANRYLLGREHRDRDRPGSGQGAR